MDTPSQDKNPSADFGPAIIQENSTAIQEPASEPMPETKSEAENAQSSVEAESTSSEPAKAAIESVSTGMDKEDEQDMNATDDDEAQTMETDEPKVSTSDSNHKDSNKNEALEPIARVDVSATEDSAPRTGPSEDRTSQETEVDAVEPVQTTVETVEPEPVGDSDTDLEMVAEPEVNSPGEVQAADSSSEAKKNTDEQIDAGNETDVDPIDGCGTSVKDQKDVDSDQREEPARKKRKNRDPPTDMEQPVKAARQDEQMQNHHNGQMPMGFMPMGGMEGQIPPEQMGPMMEMSMRQMQAQLQHAQQFGQMRFPNMQEMQNMQSAMKVFGYPPHMPLRFPPGVQQMYPGGFPMGPGQMPMGFPQYPRQMPSVQQRGGMMIPPEHIAPMESMAEQQMHPAYVSPGGHAYPKKVRGGEMMAFPYGGVQMMTPQQIEDLSMAQFRKCAVQSIFFGQRPVRSWSVNGHLPKGHFMRPTDVKYRPKPKPNLNKMLDEDANIKHIVKHAAVGRFARMKSQMNIMTEVLLEFNKELAATVEASAGSKSANVGEDSENNKVLDQTQNLLKGCAEALTQTAAKVKSSENAYHKILVEHEPDVARMVASASKSK